MRMPSTGDYLNKSNFVLGAVISDVKNICKFFKMVFKPYKNMFSKTI